ncbi:hypothetical protein Tco_0604531 [Tanacetum coccineum]
MPAEDFLSLKIRLISCSKDHNTHTLKQFPQTPICETKWPVYEAILKKKITRKEDIRETNQQKACEKDIILSLASHSYIYPLEIAEDALVDVAGFVYPVYFIILDIKEDEKRPFILGTPLLTTAKDVIKFDKGTTTLRFVKSKTSCHKIPESLCKIERGIKNDIEPIAPTMTVNKLVLKWEERRKLHQEKEMEFDQWRSKTFKNKHPALVKVENEVNDKGEVTSLQTVAGDGVASKKRRRRALSSDGVRILAMASGRGRLKEDLESSTWQRR